MRKEKRKRRKAKKDQTWQAEEGEEGEAGGRIAGDPQPQGRANTLPHFLYGLLIGSAARRNRGCEEFNEEAEDCS